MTSITRCVCLGLGVLLASAVARADPKLDINPYFDVGSRSYFLAFSNTNALALQTGLRLGAILGRTTVGGELAYSFEDLSFGSSYVAHQFHTVKLGPYVSFQLVERERWRLKLLSGAHAEWQFEPWDPKVEVYRAGVGADVGLLFEGKVRRDLAIGVQVGWRTDAQYQYRTVGFDDGDNDGWTVAGTAFIGLSFSVPK